MRLWLMLGFFLATVMSALTAPAADPIDPSEAPVPVRRAVFRADTAYQDGNVEEARQILADALTSGGNLDHPALRYRLGVYLLELGRSAEALEQLQVASQQAPTASVVWRELARAAYESDKHGEAAAAFTRAYRIQLADEAREERTGRDERERRAPDRQLLYYSGVAWILADRPDSALAVLAPLAAEVPDTVPRDWVRALVSAATSANQPSRARAGVGRLLHDHPDDPQSWRLASQLAQLQDDLRLAAIRLQVAAWLTDLPDLENRRLAELQAAAGAPRAAARIYARLWDVGRGDTDLGEPLAVSWLQAHEPDSARVVLEAVLDQKPSARLFMLMGDLEYGIENWVAAAAAYGRVTELAPDRGRAWLMLAASEVRAERIDAARAHLRRAMEDPAVADQARRLLAQLDLRRG
jgi:predicted Zn-dependent protease